MFKKIVLAAAASTAVIAMCSGVSADSRDLNRNVDFVYVQGVDYNYAGRTQSVDGVQYNAATNTLTVENCKITDTKQESFIDYAGEIPLNVIFKGNNTFKTATTKLSDGTESAATCFIESNVPFNSGENNNTANPDIIISGSGSVHLENYKSVFIVPNSSLDGNKAGDISINGVTLSANTGEIRTSWGNITISNASISIVENKYLSSAYNGVISCGNNYSSSQDSDGNGTLKITNSKVEIKKRFNEFGEVPPLVSCKKMTVSGCSIYAGVDKAQRKYTEESFLSEKTSNYDQELTYHNADTLNYLLITPGTVSEPPSDSDTQKETNAGSNQGTGTLTNNAAGKGEDHAVNNHSSSKTKQVKRKPKKPAIRSLKNIKGRKAKITWKAVKGARGYQLKYGLNKKITKHKKTVNVSKNSKTVKKLKKRKTYYFKVRAYSMSNGRKVYGKWSGVKKLRIKK